MPVVRTAPEPVWELGGRLLEGPVWSETGQALWFVDIKARKIHRFDPAMENASWDAPGQVGFCLPAEDGRMIAGLQRGLAVFDPADGSFAPFLDPEPTIPGNRLNDATVDAAGNLWFGTMDDAEIEPTGRIWRLDKNGNCRAMTDLATITNGPAISPDGLTLYHVDTLEGIIHAATLNAHGDLTSTRIFAEIPETDGYPDGPTVDAEGCLWVGLYNGHSVRRYSPQGELLDTVEFPVSAITKVAFGGPEMRTIYATTASKHLDAGGRAREPLAGALFAFDVDVPGMAVPPVRATTP